MYVNFEFAALLPSPYSRVKKCAKFKTNIHLVSIDSFLYYLSSRKVHLEFEPSHFFWDYESMCYNFLLSCWKGAAVLASAWP